MKKLLLILLLAAVTLTGAEFPKQFPYVKKAVADPASQDRRCFFLPFDAQLYAATNDNYSNLRLADASGRALPFLVRGNPVWKEKPLSIPKDGKITGFEFDKAANRAIVTYELVHATEIARLHIRTNTRDFRKNLSLEIDGATVFRDRPFFESSRHIELANSDFSFSPTPAKRLKIIIGNFVENHESDRKLAHDGKIDNFTEQEFFNRHLKIDRIVVFHNSVEYFPVDKPDTPRTPALLAVKNSGNVTVLRFDAGRRPLERMVFSGTTPDFRRPFTLKYYRKDSISGKLREAGSFSGTLSPHFDVSDLPQIRCDTVELTIENGDNAPIENPSVKWFSRAHGLFLEAPPRPGEEILLYYGGDFHTRAQFDLEKYESKYRGVRRGLYTAGLQMDNPSFRGGSTLDIEALLKRILPWSLGFAALVLAALAYRMFRRMNQE